ncbi:MAG: archaeosortase/exosortase family protein [Dongiaceae bacterium]
MMAPLAWLAALAAALWGAWRALAARLDLEAALALALVGLAVAAPLVRRLCRGEPPGRFPALPVGVLLVLYLAACRCGPPLLQIALATAALVWAVHALGRAERPPAALLGLALLALPVLPTLEFLLAYPLRLVSAGLAAALLRLGGLGVTVEGVALRWGDRLVQFDAPCSGVHMLWAGLALAAALGALGRWPARRAAAAALLAGAAAIAGNALRAASLFYVESGLLAVERPALVHQAVGLAAFLIAALPLALLSRARRRPA